MTTETASINTPTIAMTAKNVNILLALLRSGGDGAGGDGEPIVLHSGRPLVISVPPRLGKSLEKWGGDDETR